ncbi:hypothetical protein LTR64_002323 [Lithohypha guttulata]|uniref:uncharacterized protein n=1 Tax=Lithohypha guttulata TaxID=1690604 RepID=UPI002DE1D1C3|nr:hypothetical protein LTR51_001451 [Lithohypha guttulata]
MNPLDGLACATRLQQQSQTKIWNWNWITTNTIIDSPNPTLDYPNAQLYSSTFPNRDESLYHQFPDVPNDVVTFLEAEDPISASDQVFVDVFDVSTSTLSSSSIHRPDLLASECEIADIGWEPITVSSSSSFSSSSLLDESLDQGGTAPVHPIEAQRDGFAISLENDLAKTANQKFIADDLVQVYRNSLENALGCWLVEEHCPYQRTARAKLLNYGQSSAAHPTYLQRVYELDHISQPLRPERVSVEDNALTSKALKLVIMSFASQWTHGIAPATRKAGKDVAGFEDDEFLRGFEGLMQQSLWHEAQRYIKACAHINCFKSIFAQIVFSLVQPPTLSVYENTALHRAPSTSPALGSTYPISNIVIRDGSISSLDNTMHSSATSTASSNIQERLGYLHQALRSLLKWRKTLHPWFVGRDVGGQGIQRAECMASRRAALQIQGSFNVLFWFGLMCDTTSSVLNNHPLMIADRESCAVQHVAPTSKPLRDILQPSTTMGDSIGTDYSSSTNHDYTEQLDAELIDIWDLAMMSWRHGLSLEAGAGAVLQEAIPTKVLLWRRLGALRSLIRGVTSSAVVEQTISVTLEVADFWKITYGPLIDECVRTHHQLSFKIQSWYVILAIHFHLACLFVADCIEQADGNYQSCAEQRSLRLTTSKSLEMIKSSAYTITNIAAVCLSLPEKSHGEQASYSFDRDCESTNRGTALLSEPWTEVLIEAFSKTFQTLFNWSISRDPTLSPMYSPIQLEWLMTNTNSRDLVARCLVCAEALELLGHKSNHALRVARSMRTQLTDSVDLPTLV